VEHPHNFDEIETNIQPVDGHGPKDRCWNEEKTRRCKKQDKWRKGPNALRRSVPTAIGDDNPVCSGDESLFMIGKAVYIRTVWNHRRRKNSPEIFDLSRSIKPKESVLHEILRGSDEIKLGTSCAQL